MSEKVDKKRYLFIIPRMGAGGAERVIATLANELADKGNEVSIFSLTSDDSFYTLNSNVKIAKAGLKVNRKNTLFRIISMLLNGIRGLFCIRKYIRDYQPEVNISFLTHTNILLLLIKVFNTKMKLIISERADPWVRNPLTKFVIKYLYPCADVIVCQSERVSRFFPKYAKKKIRVIQNPIDLNSISDKNFNSRKKVIVGVGRLFEQKNFHLLINSFYDIKDQFPEHKLEIYGEGHLREQLQSHINKLGLNNRVFLKGVKNNVMKYVADCELFVLSSNFEGFPNALIEAMASGMPVISTDFATGVARDLIKENNGIVVPTNDRLSMSKAMQDILSNKKYQKTMSMENRKIIKKLSTENIVNKWIETID